MTISNIAAGFRTTGIHPLNRDAIQLPGEFDKTITPNVGYTPFKSNSLDKLHTYTSSDIKAPQAPFINPRPNCLKDRIKGPEVTASTAFTVPPPNVFNTKQGCNAAIASKFIHVCALYMYMYGTGTCACAYLIMQHTRCTSQVFCLWSQYSCHIQALWALHAV